MVRFIVVFAMVGVLAVGYGRVWGQVYEFSKPNVPVNDDSLGRHQHFNISQGQHLVAFRGDTMYAVWWDFRNGSDPFYNSDIYFARSTDSGRSFSPNIRVNDDADTARQESPSLSFDSRGIIHIAWMDTRFGEWRILYSKSTDGGRSFMANLSISDTMGLWPMVASNGRGIVCVGWWSDMVGLNLFLSASTDGGRTFGRKCVVNDSSAYRDDGASLALDSLGRAYVAWHRYANPHIYLSRSTDPGDTLFYPSVRVSDTVPRVWGTAYPSLTVGKDGKIYVALEDKRNTGQSNHIYVAKSTNGGVSFLRNVDVSDNSGMSRQRWPSIAADDSGNVYVAWTDYRNGPRCIYFARSTNPGDTIFSPNILVNDTAGSSTADRYGASLAVNERGEAFVTWSDNRVSGGPYDIYSSRGVRQTSGIEEIWKMVSKVLYSLHCDPNPFTSFASVPGHEKESFALYDISGRKVGIYKGNRIGSGLSAGVYFLKPEGQAAKPVRIVKLR